jgi:ABC-type antimicrobial peptide transport system ATPase subunit
MLAADVGHPRAALRLMQGAQNLLFGMTLLRHHRVLLALLQKTPLNARDSTYQCWVFRGLGHRYSLRLNQQQSTSTILISFEDEAVQKAIRSIC